MKLSTRLLRWYKKNGRDLPWRHTKDPYKILVSEIMLQQTQVSRVLIYYKHWLEQFPTWEALAHAKTADVIHAWSGLGYNRRALALKSIAEQVVAKGVPTTQEAWMLLKGVGPYTSAALTVFSLGKRAYPVDTNIRRVVGRLILRSHYPDLKEDKMIESALSVELMNGKDFEDIPQALFDLATMHCTKQPTCAACPMKDVCPSAKDFLDGNIRVPKRMVKKAKERIHPGKKYPDRIFRGRILKAVREQESVLITKLGLTIDDTFDVTKDEKWLIAMVERLKSDGLIEKAGNNIVLPQN